jgi:putative nucleotidyltransferase with HDIG domain
MFSILENTLEIPNVIFDSIFTANTKQAAIASISPSRGMVNIGELIVTQDQLIDSVTHTKLASYRDKYNEEINQHKNSVIIYLGYLLLTIALVGMFVFFVKFYAPEVYQNQRHLSLILSIIAGYVYLANFIYHAPFLDLYLVPFCIIPIILLNFFSPQLALFAHVITILLVSLILASDYQFILIQILVGMVAVVSKLKTRHLSNYFVSLLYIGVAYAAGFLSIEMVHSGTFLTIRSEYGTIIEEGVRWEVLWWIAINVMLTLLSYPLIPLIEKLFGLTSDITLVELSDMDHPLLKELSIKAQGTLQHSLQVANLSEAAAKAIGANALLVKVAAMYHDIGKMHNPNYFIENQNQTNPHQQLSCIESTNVIIGHVTEGIKLAKKYRLPSVLIDFIRTHHGTTRVEYFYRTHLKEKNVPRIAECEFRYPGPKPFTKEQAIMMIADSLEAASKSLKEPTGVDINQLVDNIIKGKIEQGQLQNTNLSFKELEQIKVVFKKLLRSINHVRIEYPEEQKKEDKAS